MSVNRVYQFLKILSRLEDNELDMTYRVLLAFADSRGIRMDAKEKVNFDRERREAETAEAAPKKSGNTRLPYALCKQAGIDTTGFTPSECWAALQGEGYAWMPCARVRDTIGICLKILDKKIEEKQK